MSPAVRRMLVGSTSQSWHLQMPALALTIMEAVRISYFIPTSSGVRDGNFVASVPNVSVTNFYDSIENAPSYRLRPARFTGIDIQGGPVSSGED